MKRPRLRRPSFPKAAKKTLRVPRAGKTKAKADSKAGARAPAAPPVASVPEPKSPAPKAPAPKKAVAAAAPKRKKAKKKPAPGKQMGLGFRASTRFKAAGYWLREKWQVIRRVAAAGAAKAREIWNGSSKENRIRVGAVAAVVVLYALFKFTPVPGVPCSVSAVKECAPGDSAVALVPADALLYAHVTLEKDTNQFERAGDAFEQLSELERLVVGGGGSLVTAPSGVTVDIREDVDPWAKDDLAVALLPGAGETSLPVFIAGVDDRGKAEEFLTSIAPAGAQPAPEKVGDTELGVYPGGFAAAFTGDELAFGAEEAVRRSLAAESGEGGSESLEDADGPRDDLPEARFAEVYLSRTGVQRLLVDRPGPASQLETFVDYGATSGLAAAAVGREDGIEIDLVSDLDPKLTKANPSFFSGLPDFEPSLAGDAGSRAIGFIGFGEVGPTLTELLAQPGPGAQGLAQSLQALGTRLGTEAGVNPLEALLPELDGQAALFAEPREGGPVASLVVEGVDEGKVNDALARLQGPVVGSVGEGGAQVPRFEESEVDGVTVRSIQLSPTINLSYAVFDGRLVISTQPDGVARVREGGDSLADSGGYEQVSEQLPDRVSALVFLNLDELFGQVTQAGLVEDPSFADLTVLFDNASSLGLAVNGEDEQIRTELFLALD